MTISITTNAITPARSAIVSPAAVRFALVTIIVAGLIAGFTATGGSATATAIAHDGAALTRLMRFMAALKALIAIGAAAAVLWRLGAAISLPWFAAYAVTTGAMAAGPGLIWSMAHIGLGALLLHGGLFSTILLFWRDPAVSTRLGEMLAVRSLEHNIFRLK
jgi:hypothetical protein